MKARFSLLTRGLMALAVVVAGAGALSASPASAESGHAGQTAVVPLSQSAGTAPGAPVKLQSAPATHSQVVASAT